MYLFDRIYLGIYLLPNYLPQTLFLCTVSAFIIATYFKDSEKSAYHLYSCVISPRNVTVSYVF